MQMLFQVHRGPRLCPPLDLSCTQAQNRLAPVGTRDCQDFFLNDINKRTSSIPGLRSEEGCRSIILDVVKSPCMMSAMCILAISVPMKPIKVSEW